MPDNSKALPPPNSTLLAYLRSTVQRLDQSDRPAAVAFMKLLLLQRIAEIELEAARTPGSTSDGLNLE